MRKHFFHLLNANTVFIYSMACNSIENDHFFNHRPNEKKSSQNFVMRWILEEKQAEISKILPYVSRITFSNLQWLLNHKNTRDRHEGMNLDQFLGFHGLSRWKMGQNWAKIGQNRLQHPKSYLKRQKLPYRIPNAYELLIILETDMGAWI